jgi:D-beta-D-heptose 7-phosphate kinase/D-beta-D-heptose 1-phosphate adenosyltransferase
MVRVDRETPEPISPEVGEELCSAISAVASDAHGAVFEDYGKGLFSPEVTPDLIRTLGDLELPVAVDPKGELAAFRGASLVKPNLREAERLANLRVRRREDLDRVAACLREQLGGSSLVITRGGDGMTVFDGEGPGVDVPTVTRSVFDVQGAGDTAIAALALAMRSGASLLEAAVIANCAAGAVVGKVGTATASRAEVCELLPAAIAAVKGRS